MILPFRVTIREVGMDIQSTVPDPDPDPDPMAMPARSVKLEPYE